MRRLLLVVLALMVPFATAHAQRHSGTTSPPTAPPPPQAAPPAPERVVAASSGMGPLALAQANIVVPDPQVLARQLQSTDDAIRAAAFSTFGIPAAYLAHGHAPVPHSLQIDFVPLGDSTDLDAIVTVELDLHLVSAILVPAEGGWRRVATITYTAAYADPNTNLGTFLTTSRSIHQPQHYVAIFHGSNLSPNGDQTVNEAHLRILNGHAVVSVSFVARERICEPSRLQSHTPPHECEVVERWMQADPHEPAGSALMVIASGRVTGREAIDPVSRNHLYDVARGRSYMCQPFTLSAETSHYEPTANPTPCFAHAAPAPAGSAPSGGAPPPRPEGHFGPSARIR